MRSCTVLQSHCKAHELTGSQLTTWQTKSWRYRQAPHVSMEAMQSTSRPAADEAFPDTHLLHAIYTADLHCSGATAAWRAMLTMLHGVTSSAAMACSLEILCLVYGHAAQRGWGYSQVNSRASTDRGSLTSYMRGGAFDGASKALCTSWFALMAALTQRC